MIDYNTLDRLCENAVLNEFGLADLPRELLDGSSQEEFSFGSASTMDTNSTLGLAPRKGSRSNTELHFGVGHLPGVFFFFPLD